MSRMSWQSSGNVDVVVHKEDPQKERRQNIGCQDEKRSGNDDGQDVIHAVLPRLLPSSSKGLASSIQRLQTGSSMNFAANLHVPPAFV